MTTENERERAQLERADDKPPTETTLMHVEVAGRDHLGNVSSYRAMREATPEEARAWLREREEHEKGQAREQSARDHLGPS